MEKKPRLTGIDLLRGIATYAVIILHSDEGIAIKPPGWAAIAQFASFAVPFFLATSFYLAIDRLYVSDRPSNLKLRLTRLLIPYSFWSLAYLVQKIVKYAIKNDFDELLDLFQDPVALVFFGGAAFHLYFLPLLLAGTVANQWAENLIKNRTNLKYIVVFAAVSLICYELLLVSNNSFRLDLNTAFQTLFNQSILSSNPWLRIFLVEASWVIRCLPYIFIAMILTQPDIKKIWVKLLNKNILISLMFVLLLNTFGYFLPASIYEICRGYAPLLIAICFSSILAKNPIISSLGTCSFGIYLVHLFVVEISQSLLKKIYPDEGLSSLSLLVLAGFSFCISWIIVYYLSKQKLAAKLMFGV